MLSIKNMLKGTDKIKCRPSYCQTFYDYNLQVPNFQKDAFYYSLDYHFPFFLE